MIAEVRFWLKAILLFSGLFSFVCYMLADDPEKRQERLLLATFAVMLSVAVAG